MIPVAVEEGRQQAKELQFLQNSTFGVEPQMFLEKVCGRTDKVCGRTDLHEFRLLVEVGRPHGREGDPLQLVEALLNVEDVAQLLEQRELVGQRNLGVLDNNLGINNTEDFFPLDGIKAV